MALHPIYQFYAELYDYKPIMWRRFQVTNNITMARLGYILMTMFEMKASHLFSFDIPFEENFKKKILKKFTMEEYNRLFGDSDSLSLKNWHVEIIDEYSYDFRDEERDRLIDATKTTLKSAITNPEDSMTFAYDFGDNWRVSVVLEKIIEDNEIPRKELPRVLDGDGYGIIEDCGGVGSLEDIAKIFEKKKGRAYQETCNWLVISDLDLYAFDVDDMNFRLKKVPRIYAGIYEREDEPSKQSLDLLARKYKKS